jgi:hypothetical protein
MERRDDRRRTVRNKNIFKLFCGKECGAIEQDRLSVASSFSLAARTLLAAAVRQAPPPAVNETFNVLRLSVTLGGKRGEGDRGFQAGGLALPLLIGRLCRTVSRGRPLGTTTPFRPTDSARQRKQEKTNKKDIKSGGKWWQ